MCSYDQEKIVWDLTLCLAMGQRFCILRLGAIPANNVYNAGMAPSLAERYR